MRNLPSIDQFKAKRGEFVQSALDDAKKWCVPPTEYVEGKGGDQFWLQLFSSSSGAVTPIDVHQFLVGFQLAIFVAWDKGRVSTLINNLHIASSSDLCAEITSLASHLSKCITSKNKGQQTSAASKIAFFGKPVQEVFIWDKFASSSARFREWLRGGCVGRCALRNLYKTDGRQHDYAAYWHSCSNALKEELGCADFRKATSAFRRHLVTIGGPMAEKPLHSSSFIERRLLDKLMFWEGKWLRGEAANGQVDVP
jgi:hypothetical protein